MPREDAERAVRDLIARLGDAATPQKLEIECDDDSEAHVRVAAVTIGDAWIRLAARLLRIVFELSLRVDLAPTEPFATPGSKGVVIH